ncbi:MAG: hypothetical protein K5929_01215 [Lachnospiraceae bacterium]|nr:hypothetical protein [Lachnospiraceae bacterium]
MDDQNRELTQEEMDKEFKNMMFQAFSETIPGVHMDEDGFIVVPTLSRRKRPSGGTPNSNCQEKGHKKR